MQCHGQTSHNLPTWVSLVQNTNEVCRQRGVGGASFEEIMVSYGLFHCDDYHHAHYTLYYP